MRRGLQSLCSLTPSGQPEANLPEARCLLIRQRERLQLREVLLAAVKVATLPAPRGPSDPVETSRPLL